MVDDGLRALVGAATHTNWLILALDRFAIDMVEAAAKSVRYLNKIACWKADHERRAGAAEGCAERGTRGRFRVCQ